MQVQDEESESANAQVLMGEEKAIIDPGLPSNKAVLEESLGHLGLAFDDFSWVILTHGHFDHFGLAPAFKKAKVLMHRLDAERIAAQDKAFACVHYFSEECVFPRVDGFLEEGQVIDLGGVKLKVIQTPGHTAGSVCLLEERRKILFSGDTLFEERWGRTDLETGDKKSLIDSLHKIAQLDYQILAPGHGKRIEYNAKKYLRELLEIVER